MRQCIARAKAIATDIDNGKVFVDPDVADELSTLLELFASSLEARLEDLSAVEFALNYYSEPELYLDTPTTDMILDGGLRARTALRLLKGRAAANAELT